MVGNSIFDLWLTTSGAHSFGHEGTTYNSLWIWGRREDFPWSNLLKIKTIIVPIKRWLWLNSKKFNP